MPNACDPIQELSAVLRDAGASPRVRPEFIVRSTLYDLDYHVAIIACVFFIAPGSEGCRMVAHWLKILQFIAVRPNSLHSFQVWAGKRRNKDLDIWQLMPRGYVGDSTHDRTVEFLIAGGVFVREGDELVAGIHLGDLRRIYDELVARNLLHSERATLLELAKCRVNKSLLRGI